MYTESENIITRHGVAEALEVIIAGFIEFRIKLDPDHGEMMTSGLT